MNHPFCMHALLACCGAEIPTDTDCFRQLARFHYTGAVAGLRVVLSDRNLKSQWVVAMLTIMMLCIYERAKPKGSPGIEIHLVGAARLIEFHSRDSLIYGQLSQAEQAMHRLVRESYIFHVATSLPFQHSDAHHDEIEMALSLSEQAICQHFRPHLLSHPDSPVLGFPPYLFRCIYTVYRLYQSSRNKHITSQKCRKLDDDLRQWDRCTRPQTSKNTTANNQANLETAWTGPRLYILGCRILLRQISGSELAEVDPKIDHLIEEGMGIVRRLEPATDYYADYYCWPFLAIGLHLRSTSDRELLMDQVLAFRAATNNGTMRRLEDMLELIWQSRHAQSMAPATPASNQTG
ncbi:C6 zinc finger domain protein [Penicillium argentinense]|uniref:C6 zinc finger domain protein n=1 Tax=Penicillium argentinense TaxID=1131581 RepID=A0A9W9EVW5_9EURO|nr:C6 zinc finger domain protein [Penicillium argentinense]KAJ5088943.1 C6 zinc finger domain protein [Penicillium argentinense]